MKSNAVDRATPLSIKVDRPMLTSIGVTTTEVIGVETGRLVGSDSTLRDTNVVSGNNRRASLTTAGRSGLDVSSNIM